MLLEVAVARDFAVPNVVEVLNVVVRLVLPVNAVVVLKVVVRLVPVALLVAVVRDSVVFLLVLNTVDVL